MKDDQKLVEYKIEDGVCVNLVAKQNASESPVNSQPEGLRRLGSANSPEPGGNLDLV